MVERSLSMREVPGSIPGISKSFFLNVNNFFYFFEIFSKHFTRICPILNRFLDGNDGQSPTE